MRPRILDLFCGAGGSAVGYHRAGFDVVGVDIEPQPHYPFEVVQENALTILHEVVRGGDWSRFDAIHASPPCQAYSTMGNRYRDSDTRIIPPSPELIQPVIDLLDLTGLPYVVENVMGARSEMPNAITLSGGMFGLKVHRPRLFLSNVMLLSPPAMPPPKDGIGVYGRAHDGRRLGNRREREPYMAPKTLEEAQEAMGMDWADWHGTKEAIPPAYTEFIGAQLLAAILREAPDAH